MCGRFANSRSPAELRTLFQTTNSTPNFVPSWNIAPSQESPVVRLNPENQERSLDLLSWGLVPHWSKDLKTARKPINARAETVATTPLFRSAYKARRCLVPADLYYEWQVREGRSKQPYAIARADRGTLAFGGVWEGWRAETGKVIRSFSIITTESNKVMAPIHDRMPLIIDQADWPTWLGEVEGDLAALLGPAPDDLLESWPIGSEVNSPRNNRPEISEPLTKLATISGELPATQSPRE